MYRLQLAKEASANGLICSIIRDAGRTQIASGSKTVLAVGPGNGLTTDFPCKIVRQCSHYLSIDYRYMYTLMDRQLILLVIGC